MIPVLIAPAYNRHDLLLRALRSVDVPVERGLVVDNARDLLEHSLWDDSIEDECDRLNLQVLAPPFGSMGYGGSINFTIMQTTDAPWWFWMSNDVRFDPGFLQTVVDRMTDHFPPRVITGGFIWGAVNREAIETVGLIDEYSFHPIYFDDNDFLYRCHLAGVEWIEHHGEGIFHGDDGTASATIRSDEKARNANHGTFPTNSMAYERKWGGRPHHETFERPWNNPTWPIWATRPSPNGRRDRQW